MRILFVTQWFDPEPTFKGLAFARELRARGHEIQVLTGYPNYPEGRLYPGYRMRLIERQSVEGVDVVRVPLFPSHDSSPLRRVANYVSFALAAAILGPWALQRPDVMYVYHPPATVGLPALVVRALWGTPIVYDVGDLWPDTLTATKMVKSRLVVFLVDCWCRLVYQAAARVVVLSPGFKKLLLERGVDSVKVDVIYNWCDEAQIGPPRRGMESSTGSRPAGPFNVVFAGTMGKAQALESVLEAARIVAERDKDVRFTFIGGGTEAERLRDLSETMGLATVKFEGRRPVAAIGPVLQAADLLLVHLKDDPLFEVTIPSKTQAFLAAGRPIVMAVRGDAAELVERADAGVACSPEDPEALAQAILGLKAAPEARLREMGENGRRFYQQELSLESGVDRFERLFLEVAGEPGR